MDHNIAYAQVYCQKHHQWQVQDEQVKETIKHVILISYLLVVSFPNASSKPCTMMVKLFNTIIAQIAMRTSGRSKDEASIAELELEKHWWINLINLQVVDFFRDIINGISFVFFRKRSVFDWPISSRDYSRISWGCSEKEIICHQLQKPNYNVSNLPPKMFTSPIKLY